MTTIIILSFLNETILNEIKKMFECDEKLKKALEILSVITGVFLAFIFDVNIFDNLDIGLITNGQYSYYVEIFITGFLVGRGSNLLYDIIDKIKLIGQGSI